jgi:hypothetical protein
MKPHILFFLLVAPLCTQTPDYTISRVDFPSCGINPRRARPKGPVYEVNGALDLLNSENDVVFVVARDGIGLSSVSDSMQVVALSSHQIGQSRHISSSLAQKLAQNRLMVG